MNNVDGCIIFILLIIKIKYYGKNYDLKRLEVKTWGQNKKKGHSDMKSGKNEKCLKIVFQFDKDIKPITSFHSAAEAERQTGIRQTSISSCCRSDRNLAGGYKWSYKESYGTA